MDSHNTHIKLWFCIVALSRSKEDSPEFSLSDGVDEARTEQALQEAFDQATGQQSQRTGDIAGMSLLQDSALGMHPSGKSCLSSFSLLSLSLSHFLSLSPRSLPLTNTQFILHHVCYVLYL